MHIFHVDRDVNISLEKQKKQLSKEYVDFIYLFTDSGACYNRQIHFMSTGKKEEANQS